MRNLLFTIVLFFAVALFASCEFGNSFSINTSDGVTIINIRNEEEHLRAEYRGDIALNDNETGIASISTGGYIRFERNDVGFDARNGSDGQVQYKFYENGKKISYDDKAQRELAIAIKELINTGFDAKGRVARLYKKGGVDAVLNAIGNLKSDFIRHMYFEQLAAEPLSQNELIAMAESIKEQIGSDYEKGQLLQKVADVYAGSDTAYKAYIDAIGSIGSDYEKASALKKAIQLQLSTGEFTETLKAAAPINSDYEKANVLKEANNKGLNGEETSLTFLDVASGISSDYERSNVLQEYMNNTALTTPVFNKLMRVTVVMNSDFEKANVLKKAADINISSDEEWISLINAAESISANFEKSNVLVEIAQKMPNDEKLRACYMDAAKTVTSDMEYANAVKAVKN